MPPLAPVTTTTRWSLLRCHGLLLSSVDRLRGSCCQVAGVEAARGDPCLAEPLRGLEEQRVDERLRQVAAQLALHDVVLLGEQAGRAERAPVALEPAQRPGHVALLVGGQGQMEAAQQERALGLVQRQVGLLAEAVDVAVVGQVVDHGPAGQQVARIVGRDGAAQAGQQQCRVDPRVVGGALPAPVGVEAVAVHGGDELVGQVVPVGGVPPTALVGGRPQSGHHDLVLEIPAARCPTSSPTRRRAWAAHRARLARRGPGPRRGRSRPGESHHSYAVLRGLTSASGGDGRRRHHGAARAGRPGPQLRLPLRLDPRPVLRRPGRRRGRRRTTCSTPRSASSPSGCSPTARS